MTAPKLSGITSDAPVERVVSPDNAALSMWNTYIVRSSWTVFVTFLVIVFAVKWPTLNQIPVWDSAMSVFPAAITITEQGVGVFDQDPYLLGGPNVHASSIITWLTAAVLATTDSPFPALHVFQFVMTAGAFAGVWVLIKPWMGPHLALGVAVAGLLIPIVRTQAGYMYLEIPILFATVWAIYHWTRGHLWIAGWFALLAVLVKPTGVVVGAGLFLATLAISRTEPQLLLRLAWYGSSIIVVLGHSILGGISPDIGSRSTLMSSIAIFLRVTDVVVLVALMIIAGIAQLATRARRPDSQVRFEIAVISITVVLAAVAVFTVSTGWPWLPRYLTMLLPLWLALLVGWIRERSTGVAWTLIAVAIVFSIINASGTFYPDNDLEHFSLIERSDAYLGMLSLQLLAASRLSELPPEVPIYYDLPTHFHSTYPTLGYFDTSLSQGVRIRNDGGGLDIDNFPDEFFLYFEYDWLGGEHIMSVWDQAESSAVHVVAVERLMSQQFESFIVHVTRQTDDS